MRTQVIQRAVEFMAIICVLAMVATIIIASQFYAREHDRQEVQTYENCKIYSAIRQTAEAVQNNDLTFRADDLGPKAVQECESQKPN